MRWLFIVEIKDKNETDVNILNVEGKVSYLVPLLGSYRTP